MTGRAVYDDGVLRIVRLQNRSGLAIAGDIDESTYQPLAAALEEAAAGQAEVHLSLAGVRYCDLAGLRAIVRLTEEPAGRPDGGRNDGGRKLVLHEVPPQLEAVLLIVGWDTTPGLVLNGMIGDPAAPSAAAPPDEAQHAATD